MREKHGLTERYGKIEIWTLEEINDLPQVTALANDYLESFPNDLRVKIKLAQLAFLLEDYETTDRILNEDFEIDKLPLDVGLTISSLLAARNELQKSFNLMYELRRIHFDQAEVHSFYQANFLTNNKDTEEFLEHDVVSIDTAVCVEGIDGKQRWFVIEDRKFSNLGKNEYNINHPIIVEMLGKKMGDEIQLKTSTRNAETATIIEIKSKFVYASQETAEIYETAFPGRIDFQSIHVGNPGEQFESKGREKIREIVAGKSRNSAEALAFYQQEPITIGMVGKFLGLEGIEIWNRLLHESNTVIYGSIGDPKLFNNIISVLQESEGCRLVCDITSLQLMYELNVGEEVVNCFGKPLIAPTTLISLFQVTKEKEKNLKTGIKSLVEIDGELFRQEINPDQIENTVNYLKEFQDWVKSNSEVSPYQSGFDLDRQQKTDMRNAFLPEFLDSIMTSNKENHFFFSEDERLRVIALNEFGIRGVWMQPVLAALKNKKLITDEKYYAATCKLINSNIEFISVNANSLIELAKTVDWQANDYFKKATNRLSGTRAEIYSSINVSSHFLLLLAKENISSKTEELLTICLLENLTTNRNLIQTIHILHNFIDKKILICTAC